jgi:hypothetical protein
MVEMDRKDYRTDFAMRHGRWELVEVKNEDAYADSGNIVVEVYQGTSRKPSGLLISESTVTVHTLGERVALYRNQPMRLWLPHGHRERGFGDNHNIGYVLPIEELAEEPWFECLPFTEMYDSRVWG